jgi:two-component system sensor histidine kinase YesM
MVKFGGTIVLHFRDLSILKKMLLILTVTYMIPLLLAGIFLTRYIDLLQAQEESRQSTEVLNKVFAELSGIFETAEWFSGRFVSRGLMWQFAGGRARHQDYIDLAHMYDDTNQLLPALESVILIYKGRVVFERGPALDSDIPAFPEEIEAVIQSEQGKLWAQTRRMNFFFDTSYNNEVLPYYQVFKDSLSNNSLILFIGFNEQELSGRYNAYTSGPVFVVQNDGIILSTSEKDYLGKVYPEELLSRFTSTSGFFNYKKEVIIYTQGYQGWYLVNHVPWEYFRKNRSGSFIILILAAGLGICFALTCLLIQKKFIFNPLRNMLTEMNQFREGNLQPSFSYSSKDEIGQINREVEEVFKRVNNLIHELYISKIYTQEARLKLLTFQINPHFLYNTLDSIHWKAVQNKDYEVSDQIEALSDLFRHVLNKGNDIVTLGQEAAQLENYLSIMNFRYGSRLNCIIDIPDNLKDVPLPKFLLQPLVENAIVHGIDQCIEDGVIIISVRQDGRILEITVSDNGVGADSAAINRMLAENTDSVSDKSHNVFALKNINRRIKLRYGDEYGITFESEPGRGTKVSLTIPMEENGETSHP